MNSQTFNIKFLDTPSYCKRRVRQDIKKIHRETNADISKHITVISLKNIQIDNCEKPNKIPKSLTARWQTKYLIRRNMIENIER
jgi:hypothetical protein